MPEPDDYTQQALDHICYLSEQIGGRASCGPHERRAAEYAAGQMRDAGVQDVRIEPFAACPSTYQPYALAFAIALIGTLLVWLAGGRIAMVAAGVLGGAAAWAMLAETDLAPNPLRRVLPRAASQNSIGRISPLGDARRRVVLCAHVDSHRTPIFYSSTTWYLVFGLLVGGAFFSMALSAAVYLLGAAFDWAWVRWIGLVAAAMQLFALTLCVHADLTPFSPGANDDASGVGVVLALARCLAAEPLAHTEIWLALTGCEEVAAYGMRAFVDAHAPQLGPDAVYIILDQVGLGRIKYLTADGLILKHKTHPRALDLARRAATALPDLHARGHVGLAYTDALVATRRGLAALTLDALPPSGSGDTVHWHRTTDTLSHVEPQALADAHAFTWQILQDVDRL